MRAFPVHSLEASLGLASHLERSLPLTLSPPSPSSSCALWSSWPDSFTFLPWFSPLSHLYHSQDRWQRYLLEAQPPRHMFSRTSVGEHTLCLYFYGLTQREGEACILLISLTSFSFQSWDNRFCYPHVCFRTLSFKASTGTFGTLNQAFLRVRKLLETHCLEMKKQESDLLALL